MQERRQGRQDRRRAHMQRHIEAIPDPKAHPWKYRWVVVKWRAGLAVSTHPVMVALTISLMVMSVPVFQLLGVSGELKKAQGGERAAQVRLDAQQAQITGLVAEIQKDRARASVAFCKRLNGNQRQSAKLTLYLKALIISGTKQGKVFEPLYRKFGFPPYAERLRKATRQAEKIASFRPAPLNCRQIELNIVQDTPPPPAPVSPPDGPPVHGNP